MRICDAAAGYGKRATNVSVNEGLLKAARELGINLSATLEKAVEAEIIERRRARWQQDNRAAIEAYNARLEREGAFSDGLRGF